MYVFAFSPNGVASGDKWEHVPWGEGLVGRIYTLFSHLKTQNLDQTTPKKMRIGKSYKIAVLISIQIISHTPYSSCFNIR